MKMNLTTELKPAIEEFLNSVPNLGKKTRKGYEEIICSFLSYLETNKARKDFPAKIRQETFVAWIHNRKSYYRLITVQGDARIIARFLRFIQHTGVLKHNAVGLLCEQYPRNGLAGIVLALTGPTPQRSLLALKRPKNFTSPLGSSMEKFVSFGKSQGKRYRNEEEILCRFDRFLMTYSEPPRHLSDPILRKWISLSRTCQPSTQHLYFVIVRRFCLYLSRFEPDTYIPDMSLIQTKSPTLLPYVYSRAQIVAILKAARQLTPSPSSPIRPQTYYFLILLLYTTGMRISEALHLELRDIDWKDKTLHIREGKFFKSRLVPISGSVARELKHYVQLRQAVGLTMDDRAPLFQNPHRRGHLSKSAVTTTLSGIVRQLNVRQIDGRRSPCIHSFRHAMAVHRLEDWYRHGENVQTKLQLLSTYLGHISIANTQPYLSMTTELLQEASERFRRYCGAGQPGEE